jgi:chromosome segregation ATPase
MRDSDLPQFLAAALAACLLLTASFEAAAQAKPDQNRDRETIRRLQQQLSKAQQDAVAVRGEKDALEKQLAAQKDELEKQRAELPRAQAAAGRERKEKLVVESELEKLKATLAERDKALADARARGDELARKEREALVVIGERDRGVKAYQADLARQNQEIVACEARNAKLYDLNVEILERYRTKSVAEVLAREERVTGLKNVEVFNIVQEYRDKLDAQRIDPPAGAARPRP